jgi:plasmid stabilization system protein ParE
MPRIIRSSVANNDVIQIASFIARDKLDAALGWIDMIDAKLRLIAEFPGIGSRREELARSLRSLSVGTM